MIVVDSVVVYCGKSASYSKMEFHPERRRCSLGKKSGSFVPTKIREIFWIAVFSTCLALLLKIGMFFKKKRGLLTVVGT